MPTLREIEEARKKSQKSQSRFFRALELVNRPHSAISGGLSAFGDQARGIDTDILGNITKGFTGKEQFGGQDVVSSMFGISPDSKTARRTGLAFDVLNPLDPLNYVGVGGLTKAGKAAKAIGSIDEIPGAFKLADKFGDQAKQGQRGLLTLGAPGEALGIPKLPIPGEGAILNAAQRVGRAAKDSGPGRRIEGLFGGRAGALRSGVKGSDRAAAEVVLKADRVAQQQSAGVENILNPIVDEIGGNLSKKDGPAFTQALTEIRRNPDDVENISRQFIGVGSGSEKRAKALRLAQSEFFPKRAELSSTSDIGQFAKADDPFLSNLFRQNRGAAESLSQVLPGEGRLTGVPQKQNLAGPDLNQLNVSLIPESTEPILQGTLKSGGREKINALETVADNGRKVKGLDAFAAMGRRDPEFIRSFMAQNRLSPKELNEMLAHTNIGRYEENALHIFRAEVDELSRTTRAESLIRELERGGLAVKWDDAAHGKGGFLRISQGPWKDKPLALPSNYDQVFERYKQVFLAGPDKPLLGQIAAAIHPALGNLGLQSWWKNLAIFGGGGASYFNRNFATALIKNSYEGLDVTNGKRYYVDGALPIVARALKGSGAFKRVDTSGGLQAGKSFTLKNGTEIDSKRLVQEYMDRGLHGGGGPDPEIIRKGARDIDDVNWSEEARTKTFGRFHNANAHVEMMARIPLMLKTLDESFDEMARYFKVGADANPAALAQQLGGEVARESLDGSGAAYIRLGDPAMRAQAIQSGLKPVHDIPTKIGAKEIAGEAVPGSAMDVAMTNAREAVMRAHFDYDDLTPFERSVRQWIPFYTWTRRNLPSETRNMVQNSGRYMPYVRALYNAYEQQGITPEDLPEWAQRQFSVPISTDEEGNRRWRDFTGFFPFMDVAELAVAAGTGAHLIAPEPGKTNISSPLRYLMTRVNPFAQQAVEQTTQRNIFTGRGFGADTPQDIWGQTVSSQTVNAAGMLRPIKEIDTLNLGNMFGADRPHRNEPEQIDRIMRTAFGFKTYERDDDVASLSGRARRRRISQIKSRIRKAQREGEKGKEGFYLDRLKKLGGS